MENATKALLISAGVMLSVMILSIIMVAYNRVSSYYSEKSATTTAEQIAEFNTVYYNYYRDNIRGTELISLMNRIIDYNQSEVYTTGTGYQRIEVTITIGNSKIINQFKYDEDDTAIITAKISNQSSSSSVTQLSEADENLIKITEAELNLISQASANGITLNSSKLQKLSANIATVFNESDEESQMMKQEKLFKDILGSDFSTTSDADKIEKIKEYTAIYYQYTQFKRAYFNCTELNVDSETGRVCEINFELKVEGGNVVFN